MRVGERGAPGSAPIIPPDAEGLPWVRLVTGVVALAMLAMPAGRHAVERTTQPIADHAISAAALPPLPRVLQPREAADAPGESAAPVARVERPTAAADAVLLPAPQRKNLHAKPASHRVRHVAGARHAWSASPHRAHSRRALTRTQVRREYMAAREQVAALTREDSGSAYLMRVAARQRAARARAIRSRLLASVSSTAIRTAAR